MESAPKNLRDAVYWAYRLFLGRNPDNENSIEAHIKTLESPTVAAISARFRSSPEFGVLTRQTTGVHKPIVDFGEFRDTTQYSREIGFYRDLFGIKTRLSYLPKFYEQYSGCLPGDQGIELLPMHDDVELEGMLEAGRAASGTLTVMELGAGWGPWISIGAKMAERRGLSYRLIAVEGSADHFKFLQTHVDDNQIDLTKCNLVHGVVGPKDGTAKFPILLDPSSDYGASIGNAVTGSGEFEELKCYSIATLLAGEPTVDIIHCDIQGHEVEALTAAISALSAGVRRVVVGTHGRSIEEKLHELFSSNGWRLDKDMACTVKLGQVAPDLVQDGAQLWVNPRLT
jgi:FkbM family methyltransferase